MDEGVRKGARRGHKGCLCFQQRSDLRNAPLGHSRELPTANNALNVSSGWLAQTPLALLQGPCSSEMMEHREPYTSGVPHLPSQRAVHVHKRFSNCRPHCPLSNARHPERFSNNTVTITKRSQPVRTSSRTLRTKQTPSAYKKQLNHPAVVFANSCFNQMC